VTLTTLLTTLMIAGPMEALVPPEPTRCSVGALRQNPDGYHWPVADIERFAAEADVVIRAVAHGVETDAAGDRYASTVRFRTVEVLAGAPDGRDLVFPGIIVDHADFNEGSVPYQIVRTAGLRGDCHAREYRIGGEYLLLLREDEGTLTPHWAPLAPTNEEIRGEDDPWVAWVRDRLEQPAGE
jgi:hypothetical protein